MLTRKSTNTAKSKMLVILPLCLLATACFSKNALSQQFERNGNTVTYRGNKFTMSQAKFDTVTVLDPENGKESQHIVSMDPKPVAMNGNKIYTAVNADYNDKFTAPRYYAGNSTVEDHVFKNIAGVFNAMPDGDYGVRIANVVTDEKGKVVFYDFTGVERRNHGNSWTIMAEDSVKQITAGLDYYLTNVPALSPGTLNGKAVAAILSTDFFRINVSVKNHQATISKE